MPKPDTDETQEDFHIRCGELLLSDGKLNSSETANEVCGYLWTHYKDHDKEQQ